MGCFGRINEYLGGGEHKSTLDTTFVLYVCVGVRPDLPVQFCPSFPRPPPTRPSTARRKGRLRRHSWSSRTCSCFALVGSVFSVRAGARWRRRACGHDGGGGRTGNMCGGEEGWRHRYTLQGRTRVNTLSFTPPLQSKVDNYCSETEILLDKFSTVQCSQHGRQFTEQLW